MSEAGDIRESQSIRQIRSIHERLEKDLAIRNLRGDRARFERKFLSSFDSEQTKIAKSEFVAPAEAVKEIAEKADFVRKWVTEYGEKHSEKDAGLPEWWGYGVGDFHITADDLSDSSEAETTPVLINIERNYTGEGATATFNLYEDRTYKLTIDWDSKKHPRYLPSYVSIQNLDEMSDSDSVIAKEMLSELVEILRRVT